MSCAPEQKTYNPQVKAAQAELAESHLDDAVRGQAQFVQGEPPMCCAPHEWHECLSSAPAPGKWLQGGLVAWQAAYGSEAFSNSPVRHAVKCRRFLQL